LRAHLRFPRCKLDSRAAKSKTTINGRWACHPRVVEKNKQYGIFKRFSHFPKSVGKKNGGIPVPRKFESERRVSPRLLDYEAAGWRGSHSLVIRVILRAGHHHQLRWTPRSSDADGTQGGMLRWMSLEGPNRAKCPRCGSQLPAHDRAPAGMAPWTCLPRECRLSSTHWRPWTPGADQALPFHSGRGAGAEGHQGRDSPPIAARPQHPHPGIASGRGSLVGGGEKESGGFTGRAPGMMATMIQVGSGVA